MSRYLSLKKTVLALMLTFAVVGAARAQDPSKNTGYCTGVPFSLTAGDVKVFFVVDDVVGAAGSNVTLRLYNAEGTTVAVKKVTVAAGRTVTLPYQGAGLLRAQATFDSPLTVSDRRQAAASVEVNELGVKLILPVSCTVQDNIGR